MFSLNSTRNHVFTQTENGDNLYFKHSTYCCCKSNNITYRLFTHTVNGSMTNWWNDTFVAHEIRRDFLSRQPLSIDKSRISKIDASTSTVAILRGCRREENIAGTITQKLLKRSTSEQDTISKDETSTKVQHQSHENKTTRIRTLYTYLTKQHDKQIPFN